MSVDMSINISDLCMFVALCVEWAKAKARADRWEEEVVLLDEEMRRVLAFCDWKNVWWKAQIVHRTEGSGEGTVVSPELAEGLSAFAHEQAAMETALATSFAGKWRVVRERARPLVNSIMGVMPAGGDIFMEDAAVEFLMGEEDDNAGGGSDFEE
jgi:hypothetical protein